jgi:hypothetical protein
MSTFSDDPDDRKAKVKRLKSTKADGTPYQRFEAVEAEIGRMLSLPQDQWLREVKKIRPETLVHLIRQVHRADELLFARLVEEIARHGMRLARSFARGYDAVTADLIVSQIEIKVLELVLAPNPDRKSDFLEVAFAKQVKNLALNVLEKHKNSVHDRISLHPTGVDADECDEDADPNAIEEAPDTRAGREAHLLDNLDRKRLLERGRQFIRDPLDYRALELHEGHDLPYSDSDPDVETVQHHINETERQLKHRVLRAKKDIREGLGGQQ